jgi:RNA polymerase sigma-70 factor (ECF subfamily)
MHSDPSEAGSAQGSSVLTAKIADQSVWLRYMQRSAGGDQGAFAALYDASRHLVYATALRILREPADAEEVTLDVYMQVWRNAKDYSDRRGSVCAWLVMLARSRAIDRVRSRSSRARREEPFPEHVQVRSTGPAPDHETHLSQHRRRVASALGTLPPEQRQVIELAFFSGLSHTELAAQLNQPLGTVKTRVRQGMIRMRELLVEFQ